MKWEAWLEKWGMTELKITVPFMEMTWAPQEADKEAAWDMYVELLTRISTQPLGENDGDEGAALSSVHALFPLTREIIRIRGRGCIEFTKIAVVVLNQVIRPFTAKWHRLSLNNELMEQEQRLAFRAELECLQKVLIKYSKMLADMAGVEDLSGLENID